MFLNIKLGYFACQLRTLCPSMFPVPIAQKVVSLALTLVGCFAFANGDDGALFDVMRSVHICSIFLRILLMTCTWCLDFELWFRSAVPKLFGCWAKFAILSAPAGRTIFCFEKKKYNTHNTSHICIFYLFSLLVNMFAKWFMELLLLLHNSCRLIFGFILDAANKRVSCKCASEFLFTTAT